MRILFAAASYSSGGIADYSLLLARACRARGHEVAFLALSEESSTDSVGRLDLEGTPVPQLSLAAAGPEATRRGIEEFAPDWISLQFNPFDFDPRGLLWARKRGLVDLLGGWPLQVMMHEIWVGIADHTGWKLRLLGALQRPAILGLLRELEPRLVHTSNPYFQDLLRYAGLEAEILPLFGNLPLVESKEDPRELLGEGGGEAPFRLGLFSGQRGECLPDSLIEAVERHARGQDRRLAVYSAGRAPGVESLFDRWRDRFPEISFTAIGERTPAQLSCFLQAMDAGLTHYPYYLCGKSGVAAAWLEHGVPLLTAWGNLTPGEEPVPPDVLPLLRRPEEPLPAFFARQGPRHPRGPRLGEVADQLLEEMEDA